MKTDESSLDCSLCAYVPNCAVCCVVFVYILIYRRVQNAVVIFTKTEMFQDFPNVQCDVRILTF
jgi:hypothetical protein